MQETIFSIFCPLSLAKWKSNFPKMDDNNISFQVFSSILNHPLFSQSWIMAPTIFNQIFWNHLIPAGFIYFVSIILSAFIVHHRKLWTVSNPRMQKVHIMRHRFVPKSSSNTVWMREIYCIFKVVGSCFDWTTGFVNIFRSFYFTALLN